MLIIGQMRLFSWTWSCLGKQTYLRVWGPGKILLSTTCVYHWGMHWASSHYYNCKARYLFAFLWFQPPPSVIPESRSQSPVPRPQISGPLWMSKNPLELIQMIPSEAGALLMILKTIWSNPFCEFYNWKLNKRREVEGYSCFYPSPVLPPAQEPLHSICLNGRRKVQRQINTSDNAPHTWSILYKSPFPQPMVDFVQRCCSCLSFCCFIFSLARNFEHRWEH